jgi:hypothetical protein
MKRESKSLPSSLERRFSSYALAASAAGVGLLALALPVEGKVVYTPADKWLPVNRDFYIDLNHDHVNDFEFRLRSSKWSTGFLRSLVAGRANTSQSTNAVSSINECAPALPKGKKIGPNARFSPDAPLFVKGSLSEVAYSSCPWLHVAKQAYLGLRFAIQGQIHYGWARLGYISTSRPATAKLTGYAYETIANKAIIAGKTKGPDVITVQPASLGYLARGAAAIPVGRDRSADRNAVEVFSTRLSNGCGITSW